MKIEAKQRLTASDSKELAFQICDKARALGFSRAVVKGDQHQVVVCLMEDARGSKKDHDLDMYLGQIPDLWKRHDLSVSQDIHGNGINVLKRA